DADGDGDGAAETAATPIARASTPPTGNAIQRLNRILPSLPCVRENPSDLSIMPADGEKRMKGKQEFDKRRGTGAARVRLSAWSFAAPTRTSRFRTCLWPTSCWARRRRGEAGRRSSTDRPGAP